MPRPSNRDLLLDTAETLVSRQGFEAVSVRAVNTAAKLNQGAAHYYFGSKEAMFEEVVRRRVSVLMTRRQELLDGLSVSSRPATTADLVRVMITPLAELVDSEGERGVGYIRFLSRMVEEARPLIERVVAADHTETVGRLHECLLAANPSVPADVMARRLEIAARTILDEMAHWPPDKQSRAARRRQAETLADFVTGGLSITPGV